jgi:hypothetical protein
MTTRLMKKRKTKKRIMPEKPNDKAISMYFSMLAKQSHKKKPRPKSFYQMMANSRKVKRGRNSPPTTCDK